MEYFAGLDVSMEETCVSRPMALARERNVSDDAQGADGLPDDNTVRWTARRKMAVLRAAAAGQISAEEIARRYAISPEELDTWSHEYAERGLRGLQQKECATRRRKSSEVGSAF
jgi:hypothetical protein